MSSDHPSPEELVAYRAGKLEPQQDEEIRGHLVACGECAELLLELAALEASPRGPGNEASRFETEAAWRRLRQRLFSGRQRPWVQLGGWVAAACLLVIAGALAYELRELRRTAGFDDPNVARVIADARGRRAPGTAPPVLELGPGRPGLVFLLLGRDPPFESLRAEFLSDDGRSLLIRDGLMAIEKLLLVPVTDELLPEGRIRVVVSGLRENRYERVEEYVFRVHHL